ncbi:MAG: fluoride efflux transporter CrcB [Micromonosporaceae bacterium]
MTLLLVMLGGAVGAPLRYLTDRAVAARLDPVFPWGTFAVNLTGSLLLGVLTGVATALPGWAYALVGTGFAGALTTYSTFGYETLRLLIDGARGYALANIAGNVIACLVVAVAGLWLGTALAT